MNFWHPLRPSEAAHRRLVSLRLATSAASAGTEPAQPTAWVHAHLLPGGFGFLRAAEARGGRLDGFLALMCHQFGSSRCSAGPCSPREFCICGAALLVERSGEPAPWTGSSQAYVGQGQQRTRCSNAFKPNRAGSSR